MHTVVMDITDDGGVEKVFAGLSRVDHVLISAGTLRNGAIVNNDLATLRHIVDERLWGLTYVVRHAVPQMQQGSITFTSGSLSSCPRPGAAMLHTAYGAERDTIIKNRAAILPGKRVGTADEVAQVILMLMTNAYMTGEVVLVDGGGRVVPQCSIESIHN